MVLATLAVLAGFLVLVWSADRFVTAASATARLFGVQPLVVGIVVVGLGTSAPEMVVSGVAAWMGNSDIAVGNALGSNITNIGLILGLTAVLYPLHVRSRIIKRELPLLWVVMILALGLMLDGDLSRLDGLLLLSGMAALLAWSLMEARSQRFDVLAAQFSAELETDMSRRRALLWLVLGLALLVESSRLLVWGAVSIAHALGVSDLLVGLTIMAVGTSLPELAACIVAARKREHDIALGNVLGSNMFNLLAVMSIPGLVSPARFDPAALHRDFPVMALLTALLLLFASNFTLRREGVVTRREGTILLLVYVAYMAWLTTSAVRH